MRRIFTGTLFIVFATVFLIGFVWSPVPADSLAVTIIIITVSDMVLRHSIKHIAHHFKATIKIEAIGVSENVQLLRNPWTKNLHLLRTIGYLWGGLNLLYLAALVLFTGELRAAIF